MSVYTNYSKLLGDISLTVIFNYFLRVLSDMETFLHAYVSVRQVDQKRLDNTVQKNLKICRVSHILC